MLDAKSVTDRTWNVDGTTPVLYWIGCTLTWTSITSTTYVHHCCRVWTFLHSGVCTKVVMLAVLLEYIIFLCGKQRKDNQFQGMSQGWSPRDIPRNLSSFLSFPHKKVILFKVLRTRIYLLVLDTFIEDKNLLSCPREFHSQGEEFIVLSSRLSRE